MTSQSGISINNYSKKYLIVQGNTAPFQDILRSHGGVFVKKGWLVPVDQKAVVTIKLTSPSPVKPKIAPRRTADFIYLSEKDTGNYLATNYTSPALFSLDGKIWDSVARYLMYKNFEGTVKATAIYNSPSLDIAIQKFSICSIPVAKTPKEMLQNQELSLISKSPINASFIKNAKHLFESATTAKFQQNKLLLNFLQSTSPSFIINNCSDDQLGYTGNLLGNVLMKIRKTPNKIIPTNHLQIEQVENGYVVRGDPDATISGTLRGLGTYKDGEKLYYGKFDSTLDGWFIPHDKGGEAKRIVFETFPPEKRMKEESFTWLKQQAKEILNVAIVYAKLSKKRAIDKTDITFVLNNIFGVPVPPSNRLLTVKYLSFIREYAKKWRVEIPCDTETLIWDTVATTTIFDGVSSPKQLSSSFKNFDAAIFDMPIFTLLNLTEMESIIVGAFRKLYMNLETGENESKLCIEIVSLMVGRKNYAKINEIYAKKSKMQAGTYLNEPQEFQQRFRIKLPHLEHIFPVLPKLSKKCTLLFLIMMEYIMSLDTGDIHEINKRMIIFSQKGVERKREDANDKKDTHEDGPDNGKDTHEDTHKDGKDTEETQNEKGKHRRHRHAKN